VSVWVDAAQQAVNAIRAAGAKNVIFVPGADWTTASAFSGSTNKSLLQTVTDPVDNFAIEVHQYYDGTCVANGYVDQLKPFEDWAIANQRFGFLGEMDMHPGDACQQAFANLLDHLKSAAAGQASGVWIGTTYWGIDASDGSSTLISNNSLSTIEPSLPSTCASGSTDGQETDVDCGGTCRRCADGKSCTKDYDCQSGFCVGSTCGDGPSETGDAGADRGGGGAMGTGGTLTGGTATGAVGGSVAGESSGAGGSPATGETNGQTTGSGCSCTTTRSTVALPWSALVALALAGLRRWRYCRREATTTTMAAGSS
jgi:hypothetical protein